MNKYNLNCKKHGYWEEEGGLNIYKGAYNDGNRFGLWIIYSRARKRITQKYWYSGLKRKESVTSWRLWGSKIKGETIAYYKYNNIIHIEYE